MAETRSTARVRVAPPIGRLLAAPWVQPFALSWGGVVAAGLVATFAITLMLYFVPPLLGMEPMDVARTLGTMILPDNRPAAFWLGMTWHFLNGIVFVLLYAGVLLGLRVQSSWMTGLMFGAVLWLLGPMSLMPVLMDTHPLVRAGEMANPGFFMGDLGWAPALFDLGAHLVYGLLAGMIYQHSARMPLGGR